MMMMMMMMMTAMMSQSFEVQKFCWLLKVLQQTQMSGKDMSLKEVHPTENAPPTLLKPWKGFERLQYLDSRSLFFLTLHAIQGH
eukprot:961907-Amphidinium_carterae.1